MNKALHKSIRGWILRVLHISHPVPLNERNVYLTMNDIMPEITEKDVASEMSYLRDKAYVESILKRIPLLQEEMWLHKITSKGIDLMERNLPEDPGVEVPGGV